MELKIGTVIKRTCGSKNDGIIKIAMHTALVGINKLQKSLSIFGLYVLEFISSP